MEVSSLALVRHLNSVLGIRHIPDASRNGMQLRAGPIVKKVGVAVDACINTFRQASRHGIDTVIVHHGMYWKGQRDITGSRAMREEYLRENGISLYAAHLPLDLHPVYGNNACLADMLKVEDRQPFHSYHGVTIGYSGRLPKPMSPAQIGKRLDKAIGSRSICHSFSKKKARTIGIVSGGGSSALSDLGDIDCLLTGEAPHNAVVEAKDLGKGIVLGGHYETETVGVMALAKMISEKWGLPTRFIGNPP